MAIMPTEGERRVNDLWRGRYEHLEQEITTLRDRLAETEARAARLRAEREAAEPKRIHATGYVTTGERVDIFTADRTATCPHCRGALILPAPFRRVTEEEFVHLPDDPDLDMFDPDVADDAARRGEGE